MNRNKELILRVTEGVVGSAVNGVLWWFYLSGASFGKTPTSYGIYQAFREADQALSDFNFESFKQIISALQREGLIQKQKTYSGIEIEITRLGKERLNKIIPVYQSKRQWDGHVYLVSYDIPETKHNSRTLLREYLKTIGSALLQESLWMTPYNPRMLLDEFVQAHHIEGTLLVSRLGHDGAIGDERLTDLIERSYHLKKLNDQYQQFIEYVSSTSPTVFEIAVRFQKALKNDPQLPFELLPSWWVGDQAYKKYQQIIKCRN